VLAARQSAGRCAAVLKSGYVFTAMLRPNKGLLDSVAVGRYPAALQLTGKTNNTTNPPTTSVSGCMLPELRWGVCSGGGEGGRVGGKQQMVGLGSGEGRWGLVQPTNMLLLCVPVGTMQLCLL
jgi:hypothetical protein